MENSGLIKRYFVAIIGLTILMSGTATVTLSQLGTGAIAAPMYALSLIGGLSFGGWNFTICMLFFALQLIIRKWKMPFTGWLQIPAIAFASLVLDIWMNVLGWVNPQHYLEKLLVALIGCVILGFGISLFVTSNVVYLPPEGLIALIAEKLDTTFPRIKVIFDVSNLVAALILSFLFLGSYESVREATLLTAVLVGPIVAFFLPKVRKVLS